MHRGVHIPPEPKYVVPYWDELLLRRRGPDQSEGAGADVQLQEEEETRKLMEHPSAPENTGDLRRWKTKKESAGTTGKEPLHLWMQLKQKGTPAKNYKEPSRSELLSWKQPEFFTCNHFGTSLLLIPCTSTQLLFDSVYYSYLAL